MRVGGEGRGVGSRWRLSHLATDCSSLVQIWCFAYRAATHPPPPPSSCNSLLQREASPFDRRQTPWRRLVVTDRLPSSTWPYGCISWWKLREEGCRTGSVTVCLSQQSYSPKWICLNRILWGSCVHICKFRIAIVLAVRIALCQSARLWDAGNPSSIPAETSLSRVALVEDADNLGQVSS